MSHRRNAAGGLAVLLLVASQNVRATVYPITRDATVFGEDQTVQTVYEDTLYDLARKYSLGSEELIRVNPGVDPWLPGAGTEIVVPGRHILPPGPHEGIVVNLPEHRLYFYPKPKRGQPQEVITYPVSIGKMDWRTPLGLTRVIAKEKNPTWYPPESVRKEHAAAGDPLPASVGPGPNNPLGAYAMRLAAGNGTYLIHGTNNPIAVGMPVTHGCIRMYPDDVAALFPLVPVGTPVRLINEPIKVAWVDGELLLEAHPPVDAEGQSFEPNIDEFSQLLQAAVGDTTVAIHWDYAREVLQKADGVIATVGLEADASALNPEPAEAKSSQPAEQSSQSAEQVAPHAPEQSSQSAEQVAPQAPEQSSQSAEQVAPQAPEPVAPQPAEQRSPQSADSSASQSSRASPASPAEDPGAAHSGDPSAPSADSSPRQSGDASAPQSRDASPAQSGDVSPAQFDSPKG
ncbi:MAG TPA: L,D-transpeptidase family protein [Steroidobacteraceae bacterium]|nr:L,D-transpeptidase family protein [Steroidobacteraceae bacterium]